MRELLIVTGLSGAGKSLAMHALEDIGYYCIDNIPANLLVRLLEFAGHSEQPLKRAAIVLDVRGARSAQEFSQALGQLREKGIIYRLLFLDAGDEVLERRYKETRRRHPLCLEEDISTSQAIQKERAILEPVFEAADYHIDTSLLSTAQLKDRVVSLFASCTRDAMALTVMSFGFKYGTPKEADIVLDVRCLPNPFYVPELKAKTGCDQEVAGYVMSFPEAQQLLRRITELLEFSLPLYVKEGKSQLTVAFGCTGGKHRSITFARLVAEHLCTLGYHPSVQHRDIRRI